MKIKIGLHGSYYVRNFGDTLILWIINEWLKDIGNEISVHLPYISSDKEAQEILGHSNLKGSFEEYNGFIFGPGGYFGQRPGGRLINLKWSLRNYLRHLAWNKMLFKNKVPYIIIGVGVGPLSFGFMRRRIVRLFMNARYISVRDEHSRQYLISWGIDSERINVFPDVALALKPTEDNRLNPIQRIALHFPWGHLKGEQKNDFLEFLKIISQESEVVFIEDSMNQFSEKDQSNLRHVLASLGIDFPVIKYESPGKLIKELQTFDAIITSKLHVAIVSYALGKKCLSIPLHPKTFRFYNQIGRSEFCIPPQKVQRNLLVEKFKELNLLNQPSNILYDSAIQNKKILEKFVKEISTT